MFSALKQGSSVFIIDRTKGIDYKVGQVINYTEPKSEYNYNQSFSVNNQTYMDITVKTDNGTYEFKKIPTNISKVNYDNGNVILSETKENLIIDVENIKTNSEQILNNIDIYKDNVDKCKEILKQLNPRFAKDEERDSRIGNLEDKVGSIDIKLDKLMDILNKK